MRSLKDPRNNFLLLFKTGLPVVLTLGSSAITEWIAHTQRLRNVHRQPYRHNVQYNYLFEKKRVHKEENALLTAADYMSGGWRKWMAICMRRS